jgi:hypothetical protein
MMEAVMNAMFVCLAERNGGMTRRNVQMKCQRFLFAQIPIVGGQDYSMKLFICAGRVKGRSVQSAGRWWNDLRRVREDRSHQAQTVGQSHLTKGVSMINQILSEIIAERQRQDAKWGEQNHDPMSWLVILMEEVGEASQRALHMRYAKEEYDSGGQCGSKEDFIEYSSEQYRHEMIQVAAVAVAMIQCFDRNKNVGENL